MSNSSVLVLEPDVGTATREIDSENLGLGPNGKPLDRERLQLGGKLLAQIAEVLNAAPAGTEYALVVRPIMPASHTVDVSDKDARILGRVKLFDSLGNVIDPALKGQLPSALISNRLDVNIGAVGAVTFDGSDRDARLAGRVKVLDSTGSVIDPTVKAQLPASLGQKVMASSMAVVIASDQSALDVSDRDARLAGRAKILDSTGAVIDPALKAQLPASLGQKTMSAALAVSLASDQSSIPTGTSTPGTGATNLGKAEDAVAADADVGVSVLYERVDDPTAAKTSASADYIRPSTDRGGVIWVRTRQLITYSALFRLADATAGQLSLTFTFSANANKQLATIYHAASATKTVRIRKVSLWLALGAAGTYNFELRALSAATAPATGNPAITPRQHDPADAAVEATCLALPTTAGSLVGADTGIVGLGGEWLGAAGVGPTNPAGTDGQEVILYEYKDGSEQKPLIMRAGTAEGYAINGRCTAAVALRYMAQITFTEEA